MTDFLAWIEADRLCRAANASCSRPLRWWRHLRWYCQAGWHLRASHRWFRRLAQADMRRFTARNPELALKPLRPYLNRKWPVARRCKVILDTHEFSSGQPLLREALMRPRGVRVWHGSYVGDVPFEVRLYRDPRFHQEGEVVLALHTEWQQPALCTLSLALERLEDGALACYLGTVRGRAGAGAAIKAIAKACHGLRAHVLLLLVLRELAAHWQVTTLRGVGNDIHVHGRHRLLRLQARHGLHRDYDALWQECGAWLDTDGCFRLPLREWRRERDAIPVRKRAQYERRYRLQDRLSADLRRQFSQEAVGLMAVPDAPRDARAALSRLY
jgi:uncharacterized protein VirK/YbjX